MVKRVYEEELARLVGVDHAIAFAYGRHALMSILKAADLRQGDEVVLPSLTCKVIPLALLALDLRPVFVDISADTLNLDPIRVKDAIGPATRAILFQHTYGNSAGVEAIKELASRENLLFIEDCAQCLPLANDSRSPGSWGRAAIFSNNLRKPLPAGSGGVAVTDDDRLAQKIRKIRNGLPHRGKVAELMLIVEVLLQKHLLRPALYWPLFELSRKFRSTYRVGSIEAELRNDITGVAFQISDYQAREGSRWLDKVKAIADHRRKCYDDYSKSLMSINGIQIPCESSLAPLYYFPVFADKKEELLTKAREKRIELIPWPTKTPIYPIDDERDLIPYGYKPGVYPVAEDVAHRLVGLPMDHFTRKKHRSAIIELLRDHSLKKVPT